MNRRIFTALCLMLLLIGTAVHAKIVFSSERDAEVGKQGGGVPGIYVMDDDGSNLTLVTEMFKPYPMLVARRQTDCLYWTPTQEPQIYSIPHECGRHKYFATHRKEKNNYSHRRQIFTGWKIHRFYERY